MLPWIRKLNLRKIAIILIGLFVVVFLFSVFNSVQAQGNQDILGISPVDKTIGLGNADIRLIIAKIIRAFLGLLGIIAVSIIIYAGYLIMTSGGEEEKITKGKKTLINAVVGLIIILMAFAIVQFVINALARATGLTSRPGISGLEIQNFAGSGGLGKVIQDHYPERNQINVARNTKIAITFAEAIDPSTLIANTNGTCWPADSNDNKPVLCDDKNTEPYYGDCLDDDDFSWEDHCDHLLVDNLSIYQSTTTDYSELESEFKENNFVEAAAMVVYDRVKSERDCNECDEDEFCAVSTNKCTKYNAYTFVFKPFASKTSNLPIPDPVYLGSGEIPVAYTVRVTNKINKKGSDISIFENQLVKYYYWEFETGTELDFSPPYVKAVRPKESSTVYRNNITQVYFNEAMDPTVTQGYLSIDTRDNTHLFFDTSVTGTWQLTNGYTVSEFLPDYPCGTNSCGETKYCMPVPGCDEYDISCTSTYGGLVRTGIPLNDSSFEAEPFSGVMDMAGNALDNGENNKPDDSVDTRPDIPTKNNHLEVLDEDWDKFYFSEQSKIDNYWWNYIMQNDVDKDVPYVEKITPAIDAEGVKGNAPLLIKFSKVMRLSSFDTKNVLLEEFPGIEISGLGDPIGWFLRFALLEEEDGDKGDKTELEIKTTHEFGPNDLDLYYFVSASSSLMTETQNCLYPGRGPWTTIKNTPVICQYEEDENGNIIQNQNCIDVNLVSSTDAGCAQTEKLGKILQPDIPNCLEVLEDISPYSY